MMKEHWVEAALTNDALVAELLLRLKPSYSSDSSHPPPPPITATTITTLLPPPGWGHRKNRSKPIAATANAADGFRKEQRGSPTTHLSWSGDGSTSDGYDESSRPSDLSSGGRSIKENEGASTSSYNKFKKRKSFDELKEEEGFLLKERVHLNKELASMRVNLHQQMATSENLKRIKIDLDQNTKNEIGGTVAHVQRSSLVNQSVKTSCSIEAEIETPERGFVLPDLNMTPSEEDLTMMS